MRRHLALLSVLLLAALPAQAETVVAVADFEDNSGKYLNDIGPATHDLLSSFLTGLPGVRVVSREKLASVMREQALGWSGFVGNRAKSTKLGNLLGADYLITGSVFSFNTERRPFSGYGVNTLTIFHRMKVNVQVVDLETGEIKFGKPFDVEVKEQYPQASAAPYDVRGKERDLIAALVEAASSELREAVLGVSGQGAPTRKVRVDVSSEPEGADIEVSGVYVGNTPAQIELDAGVQLVRISLQGHGVWEKKVQVSAGLKIVARLAPEERTTIERQ